ncbi:hypothetical protein M1N66_01930 [Thermodesulfovibrionales bacterium]|nr:hypothetical protein [Thermodesulfovibrionales bacterium]
MLVAQRTVKEIDGVRPFQKATLDALDSKAQIIIVDAPVGAGKSILSGRLLIAGKEQLFLHIRQRY